MKRKKLSAQQMRKANMALLMVMTFVFVLFCFIEALVMNTERGDGRNGIRIGLYVISFIADFIVTKKFIETMIPARFMCVVFLVIYGVYAFSHDPIALSAVFPVIIALTIYLNDVIILSGSVFTFAILVVKIAILKMRGDASTADNLFILTLVVIASIFACWRAISLLIKFSLDDQDVIEKKSLEQKESAIQVYDTTEKVRDDFAKVLDRVNILNDNMSSASDAIDTIVSNSGNVNEAVQKQTEMTNEIHERLEAANTSVSNAVETTTELSETIKAGIEDANELKHQSDLVDDNTKRISDTVERLVQNVEKVSGITESILSISSQTNLLALNASIEAARAGEAGKGFAVVADEIRQLSEQTRLSTEKITEITNELTSITEETKKELQNSVTSINTQREKVEMVDKKFSQVGLGMEGLYGSVREMSQELDALLEANKAIVESISVLSGTSEEILAGTETSRDTVLKVSDGLNNFVTTINNTFSELEHLKQIAQVEE